jgi:hypothetical protein
MHVRIRCCGPGGQAGGAGMGAGEGSVGGTRWTTAGRQQGEGYVSRKTVGRRVGLVLHGGGLVKGEQSSVVGSSLPSGSLSGRCFGADNAR